MLVRGNRTISGITKLQPQAFYPHWRWYKALQRSGNSTELMGVQASQRAANPEAKLIKGSMQVGRTMDTHITTSVRLQLQYNLPINIFYDETILESWGAKFKFASHYKQIHAICRQRNPYVRRFWQFVYHEKWTPIGTQVAVSHPTYNFGTMADVVVRDKDKNVRVVEIKTGFEKTAHSHCSEHMSAPFQRLDDSPVHQHLIQLLATEHLYRMCNPTVKVAAGYVVRFDSYGVYSTQVPEELNRSDVALAMFKRMSEVQKTARK